MKRTSVFLFAVFQCLTLAKGQDFIYQPDKKVKSDVEVYAEGEEKAPKRLLLISYKPVMHLPDPAGDVELFMKSGQDPNKVYNRIRQALDVSLMEKFKEGFSVTSLLRTNDSTREDLNRVYAAARYSYDERPVDVGEPKIFGRLCCPEILGNPAKKTPGKDVETTIEKGQLSSRGTDRSRQYMNVSVSDTALIRYITSKYHADILVFVNQFELKKTFATGEDVPYQQYGREVTVHYSVFSGDGAQLYGNVAVDGVGEKQDNVNEIISLTFPNISAGVYSHLPGVYQGQEPGKLEKQYQKKAENQDILRKD